MAGPVEPFARISRPPAQFRLSRSVFIGQTTFLDVALTSTCAGTARTVRSVILHFLRPTGQPGDLFGRQSVGGAKERRQFDGLALDDVGDFRRHSPC